MKVVIVDDTQINITLMEALVRKIEGATALSFTDSQEALDWCQQNDPDLILVDYMMPAPDGLSFIQSIRSNLDKSSIPIVMITAEHEREVRYKALNAGATDFLTKPVDRMEFNARVRNMLDVRKSHLFLQDKAAVLAAEVAKATQEIFERERETVMRLARAAEYRDPETGAHVQRMSHYSTLIAQRLGWSESDCENLLHAAPMHDVGKLGTPDHILLKPGKLDPDEFEIMKQHATIGWEILKNSTSPILQMAAEIAYSHHEKFDGSGYPQGLSGDAIPLSGRIVAVADVFDALTSERPYKKAWPLPEAIRFLEEGSGKHFDPECVSAFLSQLDAVLKIREQYQVDEGF